MMLHRFLLGSALSLFLVGCGGGTSGSGLKTIDGELQSTKGAPLGGVAVSVEATGASTVSNAEGKFRLVSQDVNGSILLQLESERFLTEYELTDFANENSQIAVKIVVDTVRDTASAKHLSLRAGFSGLCDAYFENRATIRQANRVPEGTICSLNVEVLGDGQRLSDFPLALEYAGCFGDSPWKTLETAFTGNGVHAGSAEINFPFVDSEEFCRYRVIAPFGISGFPTVTYPIDTFTEQEFYRPKKRKPRR